MHESTVYHRQLDILPTAKTAVPIVLIGCGGIGSTTAAILAKVGFDNITLYDFDTVEEANVSSQFFTLADVGKNKAESVADTIKTFAGATRHTAKPERWNGHTAPIIISAVDSMKVRKEIYETLKRKYAVELYIEGRMAAEQMRLYAIRPSDPDHQRMYENALYTDEKAVEERCTAKAVGYNTFFIGSLVTLLVKRHVMGEGVPWEMIADLSDLMVYSGKVWGDSESTETVRMDYEAALRRTLERENHPF